MAQLAGFVPVAMPDGLESGRPGLSTRYTYDAVFQVRVSGPILVQFDRRNWPRPRGGGPLGVM